MPTTPQGQITLAIIGAKLDAQATLISRLCDKVDVIKEHQDKLAYIPGDVAELCKDVDQLKLSVTAVTTTQKQEVEELRSQIRTNSWADKILVVIGSVIAGIVGTSRG